MLGIHDAMLQVKEDRLKDGTIGAVDTKATLHRLGAVSRAKGKIPCTYPGVACVAPPRCQPCITKNRQPMNPAQHLGSWQPTSAFHLPAHVGACPLAV